MQFFGVNESKIRWTVIKIKFIKGLKLKEILETKNQKVGLKKPGKIHKNREKNLQFFGVNKLKIQWTVIEIKFIKGLKLK